MSETQAPDEIYVIVAPEETASEEGFRDPMRGWPDVVDKLRPTKVKLSELTGNIKLFMQQMEKLLGEIPADLGEFDFAEFEVSAGLMAEGEIALLGVGGGKAGVNGGLKFVFKKRTG